MPHSRVGLLSLSLSLSLLLGACGAAGEGMWVGGCPGHPACPAYLVSGENATRHPLLLPPHKLAAVMKANVVEMFDHGYNGYMDFAFPMDELKPVTCTGANTLSKGSFYLTLVDTLDTLVLLGRRREFCEKVTLLSSLLDFDVDLAVSVFETNIRVLGGLLSSHLLFEEGLLEGEPACDAYDGDLLLQAYDLGRRLLPAFDTVTGIPYGAINLRHGVPAGETTVTSVAGGGTHLLEFTVLSRLTGDAAFEVAAQRAAQALFERRDPETGLLGNHIDIASGVWTHQDSGVGGNTDSYYEYLAKAYVLFNNGVCLDMFTTCWAAVERYVYKEPWFIEVQMTTGSLVWPVFNSLSSFAPGMLFNFGDPDTLFSQSQASAGGSGYRPPFGRHPGKTSLEAAHAVWRRCGGMPEGYNVLKGGAYPGQKGYPLRPEFAESLWQGYRATKDPTYLRMAADVVLTINKRMRTTCGFAVLEDVETGELRDSMESFFLAETLKYLYLIFDTETAEDGTARRSNFINEGGWIFNTEGHPLPIHMLHTVVDRQTGAVRYEPPVSASVDRAGAGGNPSSSSSSSSPPSKPTSPSPVPDNIAKKQRQCRKPGFWERIAMDGMRRPRDAP